MKDNENEKHETSADIANEIRRAVESMGDELPYTVPAGTMRRVADRIEAAWARESNAIATEHAVLPSICITKPQGNAAAMREALVAFVRAYEMDNELDNIEATSEAYEKARAALSIPPRQCDVGTPYEQANRMRQFCAKQKRNGIIDCGYCPIKHEYQRDCTLEWSQMPYEAQEGGRS